MTENNIVKEVEKLGWLRIAMILSSFVAGIVLVRLGQVRAAVFVVGGVMFLGGIGFNFLKEAIIRSASTRTGKSTAELREELKKSNRIRNS